MRLTELKQRGVQMQTTIVMSFSQSEHNDNKRLFRGGREKKKWIAFGEDGGGDWVCFGYIASGKRTAS
ncbi:hypothetical protein C7G95_19180, partial [Acinetobacter nosocomialis]